MKRLRWVLVLILLLLAGCSSEEAKIPISSSLAPSELEPMPVTIYLVRHGETEYNVKGLMQGWCDSPLTQDGIRMAEALGVGFSEIDFAAAYSSDSQRAIDTAQYALGERVDAIDLITREDLREMSFGELEAAPNDEAWGDGSRYSAGFADVGGETNEDVQNRMIAALTEIAQTHEKTGGNILVVSHGLAIQKAMTGLDANAFDRFVRKHGTMENCCVSVLTWSDGKLHVKTVGSTEYRDAGMK